VSNDYSKENCSQKNKKTILRIFADKIDPVRTLISGASLPQSIWLDAIQNICS